MKERMDNKSLSKVIYKNYLIQEIKFKYFTVENDTIREVVI